MTNDWPSRDLAARERLLPPELLHSFDDRFVGSCDLHEAYITRLALEVVQRTGLEAALADEVTPAEAASRAGFDPGRATVPVEFLLRQLALEGYLDRSGPDDAESYTARVPLPRLDPAEIFEAQRAHDPAALPSYALARAAADDYPAFLAGEKDGDAILFAPDRVALWFDYFANTNPLYGINNTIGAQAALNWFPAGGRQRVLELGGGLGSAAIALHGAFERAGRADEIAAYRFTEFAPVFLRRGQRALGQRPGLTSSRLDMNLPFEAQGIEPGSFDAVYAVNTLHIARSLRGTLDEIRRALAPGGQLIISECLRPRHGWPVYVEFVFNLLEPFRAPQLDDGLRPHGGFLTPEDWRDALEACGFRDVRVYPDVERLRETFPAFVVGAIGATV